MTDTVELLAPAPFVTVERASLLTGYSVKAIHRKREDGVWIEGREWVRAPDGRILISMKGFAKWAAGETESR